MADFASAIVGLAAAGAKVGGTLYTLIDTLKDAPNEFLALSDEVTDFRLILCRLLEAAESGDLAAVDKQQFDDLNLMRLKGEKVVQEIEHLVARVSKDRAKGSSHQVDRIQWLRHVRQAKKLRDRLRVHKGTVCNFIALGIMRAGARSLMHVSQLERRVEMSTQSPVSPPQEDEKMSIQLTGSGEKALERPVSRSVQESQLARWTGTETFLTEKVTADMSQAHLQRLSKTMKRSKLPLRCLADCQCRCHYRTVVRSSQLMADYLGCLFLGCSNLPWCFSGFVPCTEQSCRRNWESASADVRFFLPPWLSRVTGNISISLSFRHPRLNVSVQARNVVPYDSPILVYAQDGNIEGIRSLLRSGSASINDVDPYGLGLLYYAAYYCWRGTGREAAVDTCRFLLDMGANADWDDEIGNTPRETMIDDILTTRAMSRDLQNVPVEDEFLAVAQLFGQPTANLIEDFVEDRELPILHQVLLGINSEWRCLEDYLAAFGPIPLPRDIIDAPDSCGRTALTWAVEYGWPDAVRTLLRYGADPQQSRPSLRGQMPLLHLIIAGPSSTDGGDTIAVIKRLQTPTGN